MFEVNKELFGSFVAEQRKGKGYTQRELAERLFVSDKAVSKWERGLSMPDISLLIPLAEILEVSVMELLEGKRLPYTETIDTVQAEVWVKKALTFPERPLAAESIEERKRRRKKNRAIFQSGVFITIWEWAMIAALGLGMYGTIYEASSLLMRMNLFLLEGMSFGFGCYFWLFMKEEQPVYYRRPNTNLFGEEVFQMNFSGKNQQNEIWYNKNWPQLVKGLRNWSLTTMMATPLVYLLLLWFQDDTFSAVVQDLILVLFLSGIFLLVWSSGRKSCQLAGADEIESSGRRKAGIVPREVFWFGAAVLAAILMTFFWMMIKGNAKTL